MIQVQYEFKGMESATGCIDTPQGGAIKLAHKLTFKPFKNIFTDHP
jgi:hypothetical protein